MIRQKTICIGATSYVARVASDAMRMRELHNWYMKACSEGNVMLTAQIQDGHFHRGMDDVWIEFESLWFLYHQDALDKSLISAFAM